MAFGYKAYKELVIHPAPICVLNVPCVLSSIFLKEKISKKVNIAYSYFIYWLENFIGVILFFCFELVLIVPVYLKTIPTMLFFSLGMFTSIGNTLAWIIIGLPYTMAIVLMDVKLLLKILSMHDGCKFANKKDEDFPKDKDEDEKMMQLFNDARETAIESYLEVKKEIMSGKTTADDKGADTKINIKAWDAKKELISDAELFEEIEGPGYYSRFTVKMTTVHDAWVKNIGKRIKAKKDKEKEDMMTNKQKRQQDKKDAAKSEAKAEKETAAKEEAKAEKDIVKATKTKAEIH